MVKVEQTLSSLRKSLVGTSGKLEDIFGRDYSEFKSITVLLSIHVS